MIKKISKVVSYVSIGLMMFQNVPLTAAQGLEPDPYTVQPTAADATETESSYQKTFIISAYYSPLEGQKKYVTGSYASDIRLNGGGVHGADGSPVYPGMIAAPKSYAFGTKMKIPGIGTVAVHDRGGAIVHAGERNQAYDRLDVWMGYGDVGLQRALNWGRRTVNVTVYGIENSIKEEVYLEGYSEAEKFTVSKVEKTPSLFNNDVSYGDTGEEVKKLQEALTTMNYYHREINSSFDLPTLQSLIQFQIDTGIIDDEQDFGAGFFGPQTREQLESALNDRATQIKEHLPQTNLTKNDSGEEVKKLQESLLKLGYDIEVTGIYDDKTVEAMFQFQKDQNILSSKADLGAGNFGPRTMAVLASKLTSLNLFKDTVANAAEIEFTPVTVFTQDLHLGDKGEDVKKLQEELRNMNLLGVDPSGYYGEVTAHAVFKFQQAQNIVSDKAEQGAGDFGPKTRERLHVIIGQREETKKLLATKGKSEDKPVALK